MDSRTPDKGGLASRTCFVDVVGRLERIAFLLTSLTLATAETRLATHWYPQAQFAGYYVALEKGFYKEAIPYFEGALIDDPSYDVARKNLEMAREITVK